MTFKTKAKKRTHDLRTTFHFNFTYLIYKFIGEKSCSASWPLLWENAAVAICELVAIEINAVIITLFLEIRWITFGWSKSWIWYDTGMCNDRGSVVYAPTTTVKLSNCETLRGDNDVKSCRGRAEKVDTWLVCTIVRIILDKRVHSRSSLVTYRPVSAKILQFAKAIFFNFSVRLHAWRGNGIVRWVPCIAKKRDFERPFFFM